MSIKHILVPSDFSATATHALGNALNIAKLHDAKITLLHVVTVYNDDPYSEEQPFPDLEKFYEQLEQKAAGLFDERISQLAGQDTHIDYVIRRGFSPYEEILTFAAENSVDFIAMGTHSRKSVARFFLGSVAENIVHHAKCPVLTVRIEEGDISIPTYQRILVATDFYEQSERALKLASTFLPDNGVVDILHVVEDVIHPAYFSAEGDSIFNVMPHIKTNSENTLSQMANEILPEDVSRNLIIREGKIALTITEFVEENNSDLIVMGTHSMSALAQFLIGSQANKVIRKAVCPVITTK